MRTKRPPIKRKVRGGGPPPSQRAVHVPSQEVVTLQPEVIDGVLFDPLTKKNGRPFALPGPETDPESYMGVLHTLSGLGSIMATSRECAAVLGVTEPTLFAFFNRHPDARDAWESGKEQGKASLRRKQFDLATTNATIAIFLGLNLLEQKDLRNQQTTTVNANAQAAITVVHFGEADGKL